MGPTDRGTGPGAKRHGFTTLMAIASFLVAGLLLLALIPGFFMVMFMGFDDQVFPFVLAGALIGIIPLAIVLIGGSLLLLRGGRQGYLAGLGSGGYVLVHDALLAIASVAVAAMESISASLALMLAGLAVVGMIHGALLIVAARLVRPA